MNLGQLVSAAATDLVDTKGDAAKRMISQAEWVRFANEAQIEACRRALLITDSTTTAICRPSVTAGNPLVALDSRVILVKRVVLSSTGARLNKTRLALLDALDGWEDETGTPTDYLEDYETGKLRLRTIPVVNDTLKLSVWRVPLVDMSADADAPEIPARFHEGMVKWMLRCAYLKRDVEIEPNKAVAASYEALFEQEFGPRRSAKEEAFQRSYGGFDPLEGYG